jgi:glycosyltransferase involved in cell wall biosynthesis
VNVLHVHSGNLFGGVERMLETLAPATAGRAPLASSFALCFEGLVSDTLRSAGAEVYDLGAVHARRVDEIRRARRALRSLLDGRRWDVVLVHSSWSQAIFGPTILQSGSPLVRWLHAPQPGPRWLECWSARARPSLVLCNSRYTQHGIGARFGDVPVSVQYPPARARASHPAARDRFRAALGTGPESVVFVLAARLEAGKGHRAFIEALGHLPRGGWEGWIVGGVQEATGQAYLDGLRHQAAASGIAGSVRFLGQRRDVPELLAAADVYCQPNLDPDSFGFSFVEALAAGLPVITTRLGAAPEIVDHTCGVLIEPASMPALTEAVRRLLERPDERRQMSAAARRRAERFCDLPQSLENLAAALGRAAPLLT